MTLMTSDDSGGPPEFDDLRSSHRSSLSRHKRDLFPSIPRRVSDVIINRIWMETWNGKKFLLHQNNAWGYVVFMTEANVKLLGRCETIHIDGTFKTCPKPYHQVLTIHGMYVNQVLPLAFCLLKGKQVGLYRNVFTKIKTYMRHMTGHQLKPKMITQYLRL